MGDLVARLRDHKAMSVDWDVLRAERDEAADAIERLRAALERIVSMSCISGYDSGHAGIEEVAREALRGAVETAPAGSP